MNNSVEPLSRYTRLATSDPTELESFLAARNFKVEISNQRSHRRPALDSVINVYYLQNSYVSYMRYRSPVALITQTERPDFCLSLPVKGSFSLTISNKKIQGGGDIGTLGSPVYNQRTALDENSSLYGISLTHQAVVNVLETMLDQTLASPLQFTPEVELQNSAGQSITSLIHDLVYNLGHKKHAFGHPLVGKHFEQLLISILLANQPHNYSNALSSPAPAPAPRDVKRVLEYIHAHLHEPVALPKLIEVGGVPGSSLFAHFKKFTGKSPLTYVSEQRLAKTREDLMNADQTETVTTIATRWGFTQLGRFSARYRKTYGELPKETLQRVRNGVKITQVY